MQGDLVPSDHHIVRLCRASDLLYGPDGKPAGMTEAALRPRLPDDDGVPAYWLEFFGGDRPRNLLSILSIMKLGMRPSNRLAIISVSVLRAAGAEVVTAPVYDPPPNTDAALVLITGLGDVATRTAIASSVRPSDLVTLASLLPETTPVETVAEAQILEAREEEILDAAALFDRPIQTYLVTTPLGIADLTLASLTLRLDERLHNELPRLPIDIVFQDIDGWVREDLPSGEALLSQLAAQYGDIAIDVVDAIGFSLDTRAAALRFSDPTPFRLADLKKLKEGIVAFSQVGIKKTVVGVLAIGFSLIIIEVTPGIGSTANYAVSQIGKALTDKFVEKIKQW